MADRLQGQLIQVLVIGLLALSVAGSAAAQVPFACTGEAFIVQNINAELSQVDQSVAPFNFIPVGEAAGIEYNNMGFRRSDGFLYAVQLNPSGNTQLIRIDSEGTVVPLGRPAGLPTSPRFDAGDITPDGTTMYINAVNQPLFSVDLTSLPTLPPVTSVNVTGANGFVFDWTVNPDNGLLYGGDSTQGQLAILDPTTGVRTDQNVSGCSPVGPDCLFTNLPSATAFGGAWFDATGRLFLYQNGGFIFEIDLAGPTIVRTQSGPSSSRNDGAACVQNAVGGAKQMTVTNDGLPETVTIEYRFENLSGTEDLFDLSAPDDLVAVFGVHGVDWNFTSISSSPVAFANPGFNGHSDVELVNQTPLQGLLAGEVKAITVQIEVNTLNNLNPDGEFCNQVLVTGRTGDGIFLGDLSTDGLDPDPDGDGSAEERELACINLSDQIVTGIDLVKTGALDDGGDGIANVGDVITYNFAITNTGTISLSNVSVTDPIVPVIACPSGNPIPSLAPTVTENCTGTYIVTQADINAGVRDNVATATGEDPDGNPVSDTDNHSEPLAAAPAIQLVKDGVLDISGEPLPAGIDLVKTGVLDLGGDGAPTPGDLIAYTFQVTNMGGLTLSNVLVSDPLVTVTCPSGNPIPSMGPLASETCTGTYAITQADIDAGVRDNTATATATDPSANPVSDTDSHSEPIVTAASIDLVKTGALDIGLDGESSPGDVIDYTFLVTNTGSVTLTNVEVLDPMVAITCPGGNPFASLAPGASVTCTGTYLITQADIDAGGKDNTAAVTADEPGGGIVSDTDSHSEPIPQPGGPVPFECTGEAYIVQNVNAELSQIDQSVSPFVFLPIGGPTGIEMNNLGFRVTDGLMYAVELSSSPNSNVQIVQIDSTGTVFPLGRPAGLPTGPRFDAGDVTVDGNTMYITTVNQALYSLDLTQVPFLPPVTSVAITGATGFVFDWAADPFTGLLYGGDSSQGQLAILDPATGIRTDFAVGGGGLPSGTAYGGAWFDANGTLFLYRNNGEIYEIDLAGPTVVNVQTGPSSTRNDGAACAAAALNPPPALTGGKPLGKSPAGPSLADLTAATKMAPLDSIANPGDVINYTFEITNTGNVPLTNVVVSDPMVSPITCPSGNPIPVLQPGETETCTGVYVITQADIDAGVKINTATVAGDDPNGDPVGDDDTHNEPIPQAPGIELLKDGTLDDGGDGVGDAGDVIDYTFQVTNTGNVTLSNVVVSDPIVSPITCPSGNPIPVMAPGASETCTGSYTLTQADVDAGVRDNTAAAEGSDPNGDPVRDEDTHSEPIPQPATIALVKTGALDDGGDGVANVGDLINYTFAVTNTGGVTLTNVSVSDPIVSPIACPGGNPFASLAPGATVTCTGSYVLTQADIDAGVRDNVATATGNDPDGNPVSDSDDHTEPLIQNPGIQIVKTGLLSAGQPPLPLGRGPVVIPGDVIEYLFEVTNIGNVTLTNVVVSDPIVSPINCPVGNPIPSLAPGATVSCSGIYVITQADIDAGERVNIATATGQPPVGPPVEDDDDHVEPLDGFPAIDLIKDGSLDLGANGVADPGDLITYTFQVTNVGTVTLTNVEVTDPLIATITCPGGNPFASLAPGASVTCSGTYAITQADIDAGVRDNLAEATGLDPNLLPVRDEDPHSEPIGQNPGIQIIKTGLLGGGGGVPPALGRGTGVSPGDLIEYTFEVTNIGNVTLTNVTVSDPIVPLIACPSGNPIPSLAPGATEICTGTYEVTQADIDAGERVNIATATGQPPVGPPVEDDDDHVEPLEGLAAIDLIKDGSLDLGADGVADPGDLITYTFQVTNVGTVTLTSVEVMDPLIATITCPGGNPFASLAPGASVTCSGTYAITQADIDAGVRDNTATASGLDPDLNPVTDTDPHSEPIPQNAAIDLIKDGALDLGADGVANPGDLITYTFQVTNTGTVTLTNVSVADAMVDPISCPVTTLAPGASTTCTGSYAITQADIDAGQKVNVATATGNDPNGGEVSDTDDHTEPINQTPAIDLIKDGALDLGADGVANPGDLITYTFQVTNTGTVTLTNVSVADAMVDPISCPVTTLAPGASTTCTGSYAITQADIDAGQKVNVATATGNDPNGGEVSDTDDHTEPIGQAAAIDLIKDGELDLGDNGASDVGDLINYTFKVTNTGTVTLTSISIADAMVDPISCPTTTLAPGEMTTCTGSYALTQADIDAGQKDNVATATGTAPNGDEVSDTDDHTEPIPVPADILLEKDGVLDLGDDGVANVGDVINYTFKVTNTGGVTLTNVEVTDPIVPTITCPSGAPGTPDLIPSLAPGAMETCTGSYTVTQEDIDAGSRPNTATATGQDPGGNPVSDDDDHNEPLAAMPAIELVKIGVLDLGPDGVANPGDLITYTFEVTNTGNVTATAIAVTDPMVPDITCPSGTVIPNLIPSLAPGESETCTGTYAITQEDIDAGVKCNTARVDGLCTEPVMDEDTHCEDIPQAPALQLIKDGALDLGDDGVANPGDVIDYTFEVTNTGNVTLSNVTVSDPIVPAITCPSGNPIVTLAPGASETCTGSYTITQADIDAGQRDNVATASGTDPNGDPVSDEDDHTEPIDGVADFALVKDGVLDLGDDGIANPGDLINYTFTVTNAGGVTLTDVSVTDPIVSPIDCPSGNPIPSLAPGETETCTGSYAITQADIDAGVRDNVATATGNDPDGNPVSDTDDHSEPIPQTPAIQLIKDGLLDLGDNGSADVGDLIDYTFTVTNTGNVTLTSVSVTDPIVPSITCPSGNPIPSLAPGASETCTGSYAITQADIDAEVRDNTATATGTDPNGNPVSDEDDHSEPIPQPEESVCLPTIEFETDAGGADLPAGTIVDNEFVAFGMHVSTDNPVDQPAMIFDTANPTGGDFDLGTPNEDFGGPGVGSGGGAGQPGENSVPLGKVLIISTDGDTGNPNDDGGGGTLIFEFDFPVFVDSVGILDIDAGETGGTVEAFDGNGVSLGSSPILDLGNNSVQTVFLGVEGARRLEVNLTSSGAVSGIVFCPEPPGTGEIGDRVWEDLDGDGVQDLDEPGINGVLVVLLDGNGDVVDSQITSGDGEYLFTGLGAGTYTVVVDPSTLPDGVTQTFDLDGLDTPDEATIVLGDGESNLDVDFGYTVCGECEGKVTNLTLEYQGTVANAVVEVVARRGPTDDLVFSGIVQPLESFFVEGPPHSNPGFDGTLGTEIDIFVNGVLNATMHTSCSQPIGPGTIDGDFLVIAGGSSEGGPLCPAGDGGGGGGGDDDSDSEPCDCDCDGGSDGGDSDSGSDSDSSSGDGEDSDSGSDSDGDGDTDSGDGDGGSDSDSGNGGGGGHYFAGDQRTGGGGDSDSSSSGDDDSDSGSDSDGDGDTDSGDGDGGSDSDSGSGGGGGCDCTCPCEGDGDGDSGSDSDGDGDTDSGDGDGDSGSDSDSGYGLRTGGGGADSDSDSDSGGGGSCGDGDGDSDSGSDGDSDSGSDGGSDSGSDGDSDSGSDGDSDSGSDDFAGDGGGGPAKGHSTVGGRIWQDVDRNGLPDLNEPGLGGIAVDLFDSSGELVASTFTGPLGDYRFAGLGAGVYGVAVDPERLPSSLGAFADYDGIDTPDSAILSVADRQELLGVHFGYAEEQGPGKR